jgi:uncharacterized protein (TIRG00374 family)
MTGPSQGEAVNPEVVDADDVEPPKFSVTRKQALIFGVFVLSAVAFLYFVLPKLAGLQDTWDRLDGGDPVWLAAAAMLEVTSFIGYVWLFRTVFVRGETKIDWKASYQITLAGVAATRLFAAAGAGGLALTAWALRRSGMEPKIVACRMVAFMVLLYTVYALALMICGFGLYLGLFDGASPFAITMIPATFGAGIFIAVYITALVPEDVERRLAQWADGHGRAHRVIAFLAKAPASVASGVRTALRIVRDREAGLLGAVLWWAGDIATLWAAFHAFGEHTPPIAVIILGYFVGMLGNVLPLPGGIGGVDGGMIGAFAALGVDPGLAVVSVLTYRAFAFWLPTLPGAIAYLQLRRTVAAWREQHRKEKRESGVFEVAPS